MKSRFKHSMEPLTTMLLKMVIPDLCVLVHPLMVSHALCYELSGTTTIEMRAHICTQHLKLHFTPTPAAQLHRRTWPLRRLTSAGCRGLRRKSSAPSAKHLLMRLGTFSEDIITTGISFRADVPFILFRRS